MNLNDRLSHGSVACAEGCLFELVRRGCLQAGAFVPEVVLEDPELVEGLHSEFVHADSDVVEAFTYYAHREPRVAPEAAEPPVLRKARVSAADSRHRSGAFLSAFPFEEGLAAR